MWAFKTTIFLTLCTILYFFSYTATFWNFMWTNCFFWCNCWGRYYNRFWKSDSGQFWYLVYSLPRWQCSFWWMGWLKWLSPVRNLKLEYLNVHRFWIFFDFWNFLLMIYVWVQKNLHISQKKKVFLMCEKKWQNPLLNFSHFLRAPVRTGALQKTCSKVEKRQFQF